MSQSEVFKSDKYDDGRTVQSHKDETDINKILARASRSGTISHLEKHGAMYGDFSDIDDLLTANKRLQRGQQIFDELPGEVRREFNNDPRAFYSYVNDPANKEKLGELLPALAAPGTQLPAPQRTAATEVKDTSENTTEEPKNAPDGA